MSPKQKIRLIVMIHIVLAVIISSALIVYVFQSNINYFYSPKEIAEGKAPYDTKIRAGGMVAVGSIQKDNDPDSLKVSFDITDYHSTLTVDYIGILPDLFREGQGVIATGKLLKNGRIEASEILAKHDEKYMPPEVTKALEESGHIQTMPKEE